MNEEFTFFFSHRVIKSFEYFDHILDHVIDFIGNDGENVISKNTGWKIMWYDFIPFLFQIVAISFFKAEFAFGYPKRKQFTNFFRNGR